MAVYIKFPLNGISLTEIAEQVNVTSFCFITTARSHDCYVVIGENLEDADKLFNALGGDCLVELVEQNEIKKILSEHTSHNAPTYLGNKNLLPAPFN